MSDNTNTMEQHGCIVCGMVYNILVVSGPDGKPVDWMVTSPGAHIVRDPDRPLVACNSHPEEKIQSAIANHYPGRNYEGPEDE